MELISFYVAQPFLPGVSYKSHSYFPGGILDYTPNLTGQIHVIACKIRADSTSVLAVAKLHPVAFFVFVFLKFISG